MSLRAFSVSNVEQLELDSIAKFTVKDYKSKPMSILIISTQTFCDRLKYVMTDISKKKYGGNVCIKLAEDLAQIFSSGLDGTSIDYVAIISDTTVRNSIDKVKSSIKELESLAATKLCLVNGSPKRGLKGSALEIVKVAEQNRLLYINGEIMDDRGCQRVGERVMALAATACGFHTGVPFIFPTPVEIFAQLF